MDKDIDASIIDVDSFRIVRDGILQFRVDLDGRVYWRRNGEMVNAVVDAELAQAFAYVVTTIAGFTPRELIERIRGGRDGEQ